MNIAAQLWLEEYHDWCNTRAGGHCHGGAAPVNIFEAHRDWHNDPANDAPSPPAADTTDPNWGVADDAGVRFLEMHRQMVRDLLGWWTVRGYPVPQWMPGQPWPLELAYEPRLEAFPPSIRARVLQKYGPAWRGYLMRNPLGYEYVPPKCFELPCHRGRREPYTGHQTLQEFVNLNQLANVLYLHHNDWHASIGGAMGSLSTSLADPLFYFGVHLWIDRIWDKWERLQRVKP